MTARKEPGERGVVPPGAPTAPAGEEILLALNRSFPALRKLYGVKRIGLFGSLARGEGCEGSDADILVAFNEGSATFQNAIGLRRWLREMLGREVDLVTEESFAPHVAACAGGGGWTDAMRDRLHVSRILAEAKFLASRRDSVRPGSLSRDECLSRAVTGSIILIAASAGRVCPQTRAEFPGIPWEMLAESGDLLVPPYFGTDWALAEDFAFREVPPLIPALEAICDLLP